MKTLIFEKEPDLGAARLEAANGAVSRRRFLAGMGLAAGVVLVNPALALPGFADDAESWKDSVCRLADHICPQASASRIRQAVYRAATYTRAPASDFHGRFSSTHVINVRVYPEETYGSRFFELEHLPFYDSRNPCRRNKDLNAFEINRILDGGEREFYETVVSPCSERRQLAYTCEWETYRKTARYYKQDPDAWEPIYTRNFTDGSKSYLGFAVKPRTNAQGRPLKQLLLSQDSV